MSVIQPYALLNTDSEVVSCNPIWAQLMGFSSPKKAFAVHYSQQNCDAKNFSDYFIEQDQKVISTESRLEFLSCFTYGQGKPICFLGAKTLVKNNAEALIECAFQEISDMAFVAMLKLISPRNGSLTGDSLSNSWFEIVDISTPTCHKNHSNLSCPPKLTKRQKQCLYLMLRGKSAKEIAKGLKLSPRTIEDHIQNLKEQFNCHSKGELIEKAYSYDEHSMLTLNP